jgi:hypothetical protein
MLLNTRDGWLSARPEFVEWSAVVTLDLTARTSQIVGSKSGWLSRRTAGAIVRPRGAAAFSDTTRFGDQPSLGARGRGGEQLRRCGDSAN